MAAGDSQGSLPPLSLWAVGARRGQESSAIAQWLADADRCSRPLEDQGGGTRRPLVSWIVLERPPSERVDDYPVKRGPRRAQRANVRRWVWRTPVTSVATTVSRLRPRLIRLAGTLTVKLRLRVLLIRLPFR